MRKVLLVVVVVLAVVLAAVDTGARIYAQHQLGTSTKQAIGTVDTADASISGFPFLGRLIAGGRVQRVKLTLHGLDAPNGHVDELRATIHGLELDRGRLMKGHVEVTGTSRVDLVAKLSESEVSTLFGAPVSIQGGALHATLPGTTVQPTLSVNGRNLVIAGPTGIQLVPLVTNDVMPCQPTAAVVGSDVVLKCSSKNLPPVVLNAVGSPELRRAANQPATTAAP